VNNLAHICAVVDEPLRAGIRPDPSLTVWEWAEEHRLLPSDSPEPGPKSYDRVVPLRAVAQALSPQEPYERVILMKGSQIGATDMAADWLGHTIHLAPSTMLCVWPTVEFGQRKSRELIDPLIADTPVLRNRVAAPRTKDSHNTILVKVYAGGRLVITGANSGIGLRSTAAQRVFLDELDAFGQVAGKEGDPVRLAFRATRNFKGRRKIFMASTPLNEATSLILREFKRASRACDYHVPCPHCGHFQALVWDRMHWETEGEDESIRVKDVHYACLECEKPIYNHHKARMLPKGKWVDRWNHGTNSIAFHLSALYSPVGWYSWDEAALDYVQAKGNPTEEQTFVNTVLGLAYTEPREAPAWEPLYNRREEYAEGVVQPGVALLVMAVDLQADRLEVEMKGYGRDCRSWSLLYRVIVGDPMGEDVWKELDALLATDWPTIGQDGTLPVWCLAIDSGSFPQRVYSWSRRHPQPSFASGAIAVRTARTVMVVKGRDIWGRTLMTPAKSSQEERRRGLKVVSVGVSGLKKDLYQNLRQVLRPDGSEPPGYCHWPTTYDKRYFKGLVAERLVVKLVQGRPKEIWELPPGVRNEPLDLSIYARAAAAACGLDRMTETDWVELEKLLPPSLLTTKAPKEKEAGKEVETTAPSSTSEITAPGPNLTEPEQGSVAVPVPQAPSWRPKAGVTKWAGRTRIGGGAW
jgi:phage terminase large subunit GpA-like protein